MGLILTVLLVHRLILKYLFWYECLYIGHALSILPQFPIMLVESPFVYFLFTIICLFSILLFNHITEISHISSHFSLTDLTSLEIWFYNIVVKLLNKVIWYSINMTYLNNFKVNA